MFYIINLTKVKSKKNFYNFYFFSPLGWNRDIKNRDSENNWLYGIILLSQLLVFCRKIHSNKTLISNIISTYKYTVIYCLLLHNISVYSSWFFGIILAKQMSNLSIKPKISIKCTNTNFANSLHFLLYIR